MEQQNIKEQPSEEQMTQNQTEQVEQDESAQKIENKVDNGQTDGSLGKFKDTQSLLNAYNNLQAEFTKKCQQLSQLKLQIENQAAEKATPIYNRPDWQEKVSDFLQKNQAAQQYTEQIGQIIMQDDSLATNDSALEIAFAKVASQQFVSPNKLIEDDAFVEDYVLKSDKVKNAVLELFVKQLEQNKPPVVIGQNGQSTQVLYKTPTAYTLDQAKDIVKQMFD